MKKTLAIASLGLALVVSANAQGLINFNNSSAAGTKISTNAVVGGAAVGLTGPSLVAGQYYFALFSSTSATTVSGSSASVLGTGNYAFGDAAWTFQGTATNGTTRAGQVQGPGALVLNGIGGAGTGRFVVLGWSANIGSTLASVQSWYNNGNPAVSGWIGESSVTGVLTAGDGAGVSTPSPFGTAAPFTPGFTLGLISPVPEPATMALAGLGGLAMLALRRKK